MSIYEPHVQPIVGEKSWSETGFGAKIHPSLVDGFSFLGTLSWDAFNEGKHLIETVEKYRLRFGFYPGKVLANKIYCTRANRIWLGNRGINLAAKPLRQISGEGSGKPRKSGREKPDRRGVWVGKNRIRH